MVSIPHVTHKLRTRTGYAHMETGLYIILQYESAINYFEHLYIHVSSNYHICLHVHLNVGINVGRYKSRSGRCDIWLLFDSFGGHYCILLRNVHVLPVQT